MFKVTVGLLCLMAAAGTDGSVLESYKHTDWGTWGQWEYCAEGHKVVVSFLFSCLVLYLCTYVYNFNSICMYNNIHVQ